MRRLRTPRSAAGEPSTRATAERVAQMVADMVTNILIEVLGTMAEQERLRTRQRQAEGYAAARAAGRKMGRPRLARPPQWPEIYAAWQAGELTAKEAAQRLGIGRSTFYKLASEK